MSFNFLGKPFKYNNAKGAAQFAALSTKSHIGSPDIGLIRAVRNAQKTAQIRTPLRGFTKTEIATNISNIPIRGSNVIAVAFEMPTALK